MEKQAFKAFIVFPVHLFKDIDLLKEYDKVYMFEEPTYFCRFKFHKLKLMYHRATMKWYFDYLQNNKINVAYIEYKIGFDDVLKKIKEEIGEDKSLTVGYYDPVDHDLSAGMAQASTEQNVELEMYENRQFTCTNFDLNDYMADSHHDGNQHKKYHHDGSFYKWQRRRLNILMGKNGADPQRWSYDTENRKSFHPSSKMKVPILPKPIDSKYINEAREYIEANFKDNYGSTSHFIYPLNFEEAETWLDKFLEIKLDNYGPFQDAVHTDYPFMFHALLSPMMNIGLLPAPLIVEKTMAYYKMHPKIAIQSVEGFIRQIIGWREYVRLIYVFEGEKQKKSNFFNNQNRINKRWYGKGGLGIHVIDDLVKKCDKYAYLHHIERLMYAGNFMLLCGIHPDDAFRWFMEYFIDSYDWVMVPNTYGMTQHADGGLMMTRPYFSSSNYILKMSSYKKGATLIVNKKEHDWTEVFDALYYHFIDIHEETLKKYYATSRNCGHWDRKSKVEQQRIRDLAEGYIREYIQAEK